jgi:hypothetical protein
MAVAPTFSYSRQPRCTNSARARGDATLEPDLTCRIVVRSQRVPDAALPVVDVLGPIHGIERAANNDAAIGEPSGRQADARQHRLHGFLSVGDHE